VLQLHSPAPGPVSQFIGVLAKKVKEFLDEGNVNLIEICQRLELDQKCKTILVSFWCAFR